MKNKINKIVNGKEINIVSVNQNKADYEGSNAFNCPNTINNSIVKNNNEKEKAFDILKNKNRSHDGVTGIVSDFFCQGINNYNVINYINLSEVKKKKGSNGMEPNKLIHDSYYNKRKYLNVINKKEKETFDVVSKVRQFFHPNDIIYNINKYINFSVDNSTGAEYAPVVLMVRHQPDELDLSPERVPGSNPGWSDSASEFNDNNFINVNKKRMRVVIEFYLNSRKIKKCKSGHPRMQNPIMLYFKARGIHTALPGNSYCFINIINYINFMDKGVLSKIVK